MCGKVYVVSARRQDVVMRRDRDAMSNAQIECAKTKQALFVALKCFGMVAAYFDFVSYSRIVPEREGTAGLWLGVA